MTHAPTAVAAITDVDLPRPRSFTALVSDDRASAIKQRVFALLRSEGMRAFGQRRRGVSAGPR
jgi:hypothetical protein